MSSQLSKVVHKAIKKLFYSQVQDEVVSTSIIKEALLNEQPSMIARFGSTEIKAILFPKTPWIFKPLIKKLMNYDPVKKQFMNMKILSGFFPSNKVSINRFSALMYDDMKLLDILGSWRIEERFLFSHFSKAKLVPLSTLEPYFQENPWSEVLKDKKVLVIHPFNKTIESQYHNFRKELFDDPRVLPEFKSLQTIKAVQTLAGKKVEHEDWFVALDFMKAEIDKKNFDIAIIGAGAYGFPLAAHVKRLGKKAVHLGGPTQILFGIKGKRWVENDKFKDIINSYFVNPSNDDMLIDSDKVEGGCYW